MIKIKIPKIIIDNDKDYHLEEINQLKKKKQNLRIKLSNMIKSQEFIYSNKYNSKINKYFNPYHFMSDKICKKYNIQICSIGFLKFIELIETFNLIDKKKIINYCDNACLPGGFIFAFHYKAFLKKKKINWVANSLFNNNSIKDYYNLFKSYPQNFIMGDTNGDITNFDTLTTIIKNVLKKFKNGVDIYSSDGGFEFKNYCNEENEYSKLLLSQIYLGLNILSKNGSMIIKLFTFLNDETIHLIGILSYLFEKVYIVKPLTSKSYNSEAYISCKTYNGLNFNFINKLKEKLKENNKKILKNGCITNILFYKKIYEISNFLIDRQCKSLNDRLIWVKKMNKYKIHHIVNSLKKSKKNNLLIKKWIKMYNIKYIPKKHYLKLHNKN